jgi:uncharacterized delta-60 repeat protein
MRTSGTHPRRRTATAILAALGALALAAPSAAADPGQVDPSCGTGGFRTVAFASEFAGAEDVAVLPNGRILLAGGARSNVALARLTAGGEPDSGFGSGGSAIANVFGGTVTGMAVQSDGKFVVTGSVSTPDGNQLVLARFLPGGKLDHTFSGDGKLELHFGFGDVDGADVAIQSDGKIVVAGDADETGPGFPGDMAVFRFRPAGSLDRTFNLDGSKIIPFGASFGGFASAVAIQGDGKIVVAGTEPSPGGDLAIAAARLLPDGRLDGTFGSGGRTLVNPTSGDDIGRALAIQPNGRIVITGLTEFFQPNQQAVTVRLTAGGAPDNAFSGDGFDVFTPPSGTTQGQDVALAGNGKIVVAATASVSGGSQIDLIRYTSGGVLDGSFGTGGLAVVDDGSHSDRAGALAIQPNGRIVIVGSAQVSGNSEFLAARVLAA